MTSPNESFAEAKQKRFAEAKQVIYTLDLPDDLYPFDRDFYANRKWQGIKVDHTDFIIELYEFHKALLKATGYKLDKTFDSAFYDWCDNKRLPNYKDFVDAPLPVSAFIGYNFETGEQHDIETGERLN